jgi:putative transcriptional regulator
MNDMRHPDGGWLMDYACGHLSPAFDIVIATHLLGCTSCRIDLQCAERLAAELMVNDGALVPGLVADDILGSQRNAPDMPGWRPSGAVTGALDLTAVAGNYLSLGEPALRWRGVGGGVAVAKLRSGDGDRLWLLRAQPGAVLPRHSHSGSELTVVLQGAYVIDDQVFSVGDLEDADESIIHQPIVTTRGECLCLAATTGPLKFDGWAARLAQRYLGI